MNFLHLSYWPGLLLAFLAFVFIVITLEKKFFRLVKTYWFYRRSFFSLLSSVLLCAGLGLLLFSLLDPRGPEERIKTEVPSEKTIILIDTSASMLAEDVKPSRLQKSVLIAKHFARKAVGQQISIVAFAEIQKKIVPFTNDLDLIDSRLESIKNLKNQYGSSALSSAIQESLQYFKEAGDSRGNILVFTDGEETSGGLDLKVPKDFHIALVGVGTSQGGRIPLDDSRGLRFGYKKHHGADVVTKLNENFFKRTASDLPSAKYWIANSYTLPSDEIIDFFRHEKFKGENQQDMVIRPVMMEWFVVPALLCFVLAYVLKWFRVFTLGLLFIVLPVGAQEEKQVELSPETQGKLLELQQGKLNHLERLKLADDLLKAGAKEEALALYEENLPLNKISGDVPPEAYMNYGTALLEKGEEQKGLGIYENLKDALEKSPKAKELGEIMDKNVVSHFMQKEQQQKQKKQDDKKNKENQDNQQNNQSSSGKGKSGQESKDQKNQKKDQGQSQDQKKEEKDKKGEEQKPEDENKDNQDKESAKDKEKSKPLPPKKVPAKLKQLMSDDRQLQMKMIENGTRDLNKSNPREKKDW